MNYDEEKIAAPAVAEPNDTRQVKAAFCQHCGNWIRVAAFPLCDLDRRSRRQFNQYIKDGNRIEVMLLNEWNTRPIGSMCKCP